MHLDLTDKNPRVLPHITHTDPVSAAKILEEIEGQSDGGADWVGYALREMDPTCKFVAVPEVFPFCLKS
jgi:hypothetical protein